VVLVCDGILLASSDWDEDVIVAPPVDGWWELAPVEST